MFDLFKHHRRAELRKQPLSADERAIVTKNVPYWAKLDAAERSELEGLIRIFLAEKSFEGCGGLELTDEIRLTIAAQASLLLLHRDTDIYPNVDAILVYPSAYRVPTRQHEGAVVIEGTQDRVGESWTRGIVVLAWDHARSGRALSARRPCGSSDAALTVAAGSGDAEAGPLTLLARGDARGVVATAIL